MRILIVDDNQDLAEVVVDYFKQLKYEAVMATDGEKALDIVLNSKVDFIFCDLRMPTVDGTQFLINLRNSKNHQIPFFVLTGDTPPNISELSAWGALGYLVKPYSLDDLRAIINTPVFTKR